MNAEIDLLGGFAVRIDGRPIPPREWRRRQAASLVKLLALAPRRTLPGASDRRIVAWRRH
jgi:DNA-binding SARP family transcriptional activator